MLQLGLAQTKKSCCLIEIAPNCYIVCIATMAAVPPEPAPDPQFVGPPQKGRGVHGQYVYAIVMVQPTPEVLQRGVKQPSDFDRVSFQELLAQCHMDCDVEVMRSAVNPLQVPTSTGWGCPWPGSPQVQQAPGPSVKKCFPP